jgi:acyl carrier protein
LLKESTPKRGDLTSNQETPQDSALYSTLLAAEAKQRQRLLEEYLQTLVARILRSAPSRIAFDKPLGTLGLDSLMGVELRNKLETNLRLKLSATLVWNYPTIQQLASYLADKLGAPLESNSTNGEKTSLEDEKPEPGKIGKLLADIDSLSDEEVMQSLLHRK